MMRTLIPILALLCGCALAMADDPAPASPAEAVEAAEPPELAAIEQRSGGTLGVVLLDDAGRVLLDYRADERMAFCSAFKLALSGAAFDAAAEGKIDLGAKVELERADFPGYQPVMEKKLVGDRGQTTLGDAIEATLSLSDNMAANLLIDALGGPEQVTERWRSWGDDVSRLDRRETELNQNAPGDPRDTSTPRALADVARRLITGDILEADHRDQLARLTHKATTGLARVRAGLPEGWSAGDKTGTCKPTGQPDRQHNDIGWFRAADGRLYWFAVLMARPSVSFSDANALQAEIGTLLGQVATDGKS